MDPAHLLAEARALVDRPRDELEGLWPRAAALLARQALEQALERLWAVRAPSLRSASARARLTCLPAYLGDPRLAGDVAYTRSALSEACHHRSYALGPTEGELHARLDVVERVIERLATVSR